MAQWRVAAVEFLDLILGEIADPHLARRRHRTVHRRELRREQPRERRLAIAVAAEQRDAVVGIDAEVEPRQDRFARRLADARAVARAQWRFQPIGARGVEEERTGGV